MERGFEKSFLSSWINDVKVGYQIEREEGSSWLSRLCYEMVAEKKVHLA